MGFSPPFILLIELLTKNFSDMETKKCTHCGRVLPTSNFHKSSYTKDGLYTICKDCRKEQQKKSRLKRSASPQLNPALADFTPQELIEQLRALGYKGSLEYVETKTHLIKL